MNLREIEETVMALAKRVGSIPTNLAIRRLFFRFRIQGTREIQNQKQTWV